MDRVVLPLVVLAMTEPLSEALSILFSIDIYVKILYSSHMKKLISSLIFVLLIGAASYLAYKQFLMTPEVFVPYESQKLQNRATNLDSTNRAFVENRMAGIQKVISEFKPETPKNDQINYYFALSADQQMLGL